MNKCVQVMLAALACLLVLSSESEGVNIPGIGGYKRKLSSKSKRDVS